MSVELLLVENWDSETTTTETSCAKVEYCNIILCGGSWCPMSVEQLLVENWDLETMTSTTTTTTTVEEV